MITSEQINRIIELANNLFSIKASIQIERLIGCKDKKFYKITLTDQSFIFTWREDSLDYTVKSLIDFLEFKIKENEEYYGSD